MTYLFLLLLALLLIGPRNLAKLMAHGATLYAQLKKAQRQFVSSLQEQVAGMRGSEVIQIPQPPEQEAGGARSEESLSHAS